MEHHQQMRSRNKQSYVLYYVAVVLNFCAHRSSTWLSKLVLSSRTSYYVQYEEIPTARYLVHLRSGGIVKTLLNTEPIHSRGDGATAFVRVLRFLDFAQLVPLLYLVETLYFVLCPGRPIV